MFQVMGMFDRSLGMFQPFGALTAFTPAALFKQGEQGAWYDPSDFSTMFQDSAGTTPVTAIEQPVGRILDKSGRGNTATQSTTTSRPILRNLYNLLQYTEQFNDAYWSKASNCSVAATQYISPIGDDTAEKIQVNTNGQAFVVNTAFSTTNLRSSSVTLSYSLAPAGKGFAYIQVNETAGGTIASTARINLTTGAIVTIANAGGGLASFAATSVAQNNGYYRLTISFTINAASTQIQAYSGPCDSLSTSNTTTSGTDGVYIWGASLVPTNEASLPYQRVVTNTLGSGVYDTDLTKFKPYLAFDGTDDWLETANVDFSATDKMSVFAGFFWTAGSNAGMLLETSTNAGALDGTFYWYLDVNFGPPRFSIRGTTSAKAFDLSPGIGLSTNVIDINADIAAATLVARRNGAAATVIPTGSTSAGNFGNLPLYVGRRAGTSLPFSGRVYSLIIRGALTSGTQLTNTETWVATKTGVTL